MKRTLLMLVSNTLFVATCLSQVTPEEFANLQKKVEDLVEENKKQTKEINGIYIRDYAEMQNSINNALTGAKALSTLAINTEILKVVSTAEKTMLSINNVSNNESMGLDFKTQLVDIATDVLVAEKEENQTPPMRQRRSRVKNLISSIANNNIVGTLLKSNPLTSIAYSIVNQALSASEIKFISDGRLTNDGRQVIIESGFKAPEEWKDFRKNYKDFKGSWDSLGGKFTGINQTERIISDDAIIDFTKKIDNYIQIYDSLNVINANFDLAIKNWESKYTQTVKEASRYAEELYNSFKTESENNTVKLTFSVAENRFNALKDTTRNSLKLILQNQTLNKSLRIANQYTLLESNTNIAYLDFLNIQVRFINSYIRVLDNTEEKAKTGVIKLELKNLKKTKKELTESRDDLKVLIERYKELVDLSK